MKNRVAKGSQKEKCLYLIRGFWQKPKNQFWKTNRHNQEKYAHLEKLNPALVNSIIPKTGKYE